jgi:hypothetical protein
MRSYRDSTWNKGDDRDSFILGATQLAWLHARIRIPQFIQGA